MISSLRRRAGLAILVTAAALMAARGEMHAQWISVGQDGWDAAMHGVQFPSTTTGYGLGNGQFGSSLLKTTDAGATWTLFDIPGALLFGIQFFNPDTGIVAGYAASCQCGLIAKTTDGGATWASATIETTFGLYSVSFVSNDTGFVCGYNGMILKTTDGGNNWRRVKTNTSDVFRRMFMASSTTGYAVAGLGATFNQPGQIYKTTDAGEHWNRIQDYTGAKVFADLWFTNDDVGYMVGSDGRECIYRTTNGGASWDSIYSGPQQEVLQAVAFVDARTGYAAGSSGRVLRTTDAGATWTFESTEKTATLLSLAATRDAMYAFGDEGTMLKRPGAPARVESSRAETGITVVPQPFDESATIHVKNAPAAARYTFRLSDISGRMVRTLEGTLDGDGFQIERDGLPAGTYLFELKINDGAVQPGRLIIR